MLNPSIRDALVITGIFSASVLVAVVGGDIVTTGAEEAKKRATEIIKQRRSAADAAIAEDFIKSSVKVDQIHKTEQDKRNSLINSFKETSGYNKETAQIEAERLDEIASYKNEIGVDQQIKNFKAERDSANAAFKKDHNIDSRIAAQNRNIEDAKEKATFQATFAKDEAVTRTINEVRDKKIKTAKREIKKIENEFKEYSESQDRIYNRKVNALNKSVSEKTAEITEKYSAKKEVWEAKLRAEKERIESDITKDRSVEDWDYISTFGYKKQAYKELLASERKQLNEICSNLKFSDYMAAWCLKNGISKTAFAIIFCLPVFAAGCGLVWFATNFVGKVTSKM